MIPASDRQMIAAMQRELDQLIVEEQIDMEVQERLRAAQRPPTPYERTPQYLAEQEAIEAELAVAREARRQLSASQLAENASSSLGCVAIKRCVADPELQRLHEELAVLEPAEVGDVDTFDKSTYSTQSNRSLTRGSCVTEDDRVCRLRQALHQGRERQASLDTLRAELERQAVDVVHRASKHMRDLETARAAAAVAAEYERKFQNMRLSLRKEVLREAFGDSAFRPLSPIRVEQADLLLEFPYEDDAEFGCLSDPSKSLDELLDEFRDKPNVWCFFTNRCPSVFEQDDAMPVVTPPSALAVVVNPSCEVHPLQTSSLSITTPRSGDNIDGAPVREFEEPQMNAVVGTCGGFPAAGQPCTAAVPHEEDEVGIDVRTQVPESILRCRAVLQDTRGPLAALEEEQRQCEASLRARQEGSKRLQEERARRSCTEPSLMPVAYPYVDGTDDDVQGPTASERKSQLANDPSTQRVESMHSIPALFATSAYVNFAAVAATTSSHDVPSTVAPTIFPEPNPEIVARALLGGTTAPTQEDASVGEAQFAGLGVSGYSESTHRDASLIDESTRGSMNSSACSMPPSLLQSLSRRSLTKILRFNPALDGGRKSIQGDRAANASRKDSTFSSFDQR